jgi:hypothetical protein
MSSLAEPSPLDSRVQRLERKVRYLSGSLVLFVGLSIVVALHDVRAMRRSFVTASLFAREFNIPPPSDLSVLGGGFARSTDGKSIALWLAANSLFDPASQHQTRIELGALGAESFVFIDRSGKRRLQLALQPNGDPSITLWNAEGRVVWAAPTTAP